MLGRRTDGLPERDLSPAPSTPSATCRLHWQSWTFDPSGDFTSQIDHATAGSASGDNTSAYSYQYPGHANAVDSVTTTNSATNSSSTTKFGYDADGNMTSMGGTTASWNYNGTLASEIEDPTPLDLKIRQALEGGSNPDPPTPPPTP
jgi:YD repeat-containing protein